MKLGFSVFAPELLIPPNLDLCSSSQLHLNWLPCVSKSSPLPSCTPSACLPAHCLGLSDRIWLTQCLWVSVTGHTWSWSLLLFLYAMASFCVNLCFSKYCLHSRTFHGSSPPWPIFYPSLRFSHTSLCCVPGRPSSRCVSGSLLLTYSCFRVSCSCPKYASVTSSLY